MREQRQRPGGRIPIAERGPGRSYRPDDRPPSVYGAHQPGIATRQPQRLALGSFDLVRESAAELRELLAAWTAAAERLMQSQPLTITLGLGPGAFAIDPLRSRRPAGLRELPGFPGEALDPAACGGDLCLLAASDAGAAADGALEQLAADARGAAAPRWRQRGFLGGAAGARRDLLGFRSGTMNLRRGIDLDRHVWIGGRERSWMLGGTFLVVRRIRLDLAAWRRLPQAAQERVIGRYKDSDAPIGGRRRFDPPVLARLPPASHARLAAPRSNGGRAMLRRGYDYDNGGGDAGLLFLAFVADPQRQYVPVQRRLAEHDALSGFSTAVGSAVFAIPPGARAGGFIADGLFGWSRSSSISEHRQ